MLTAIVGDVRCTPGPAQRRRKHRLQSVVISGFYVERVDEVVIVRPSAVEAAIRGCAADDLAGRLAGSIVARTIDGPKIDDIRVAEEIPQICDGEPDIVIIAFARRSDRRDVDADQA